MTTPPCCPDCSSAEVRDILYGMPSPALAERASRGEVVLGGCVMMGNDPVWYCRSCRGQFGHPQKPPDELPRRTRDEWAELVVTMLPQPVRTNAVGELLAGDPVLVIVRVDATAIHIMRPVTRLDDQNTPVSRGVAFAKVPLGTRATRVAELIRVAWGEQISSYSWCPVCHRASEAWDYDPIVERCCRCARL